MFDVIAHFRGTFHRRICERVLCVTAGNLNLVDSNSKLSQRIAENLIAKIPYNVGRRSLNLVTATNNFKLAARQFIESSLRLLSHKWPPAFNLCVADKISAFEEYEHLAVFDQGFFLGPLADYLITPDIVVARDSVTDSELNKRGVLGKDKTIPKFSPLRSANAKAQTLHASISCKWTIRSDRSQNARTEGLNLIRTRKGHTPHITVLTGEPMPTRIASLAVGTGDIDCVYHFALHELIQAVNETEEEAAIDSLTNMVDGRRLRDISDLPFDLAL